MRNKTLRPKAQRGISSCQALVCRFQCCGCGGLVRAAGGSQRQGQPGVGTGVLGGAQLRVGSQRCGTVTLGCCYGLLAAGRNVAQCFAEEFILVRMAYPSVSSSKTSFQLVWNKSVLGAAGFAPVVRMLLPASWP